MTNPSASSLMSIFLGLQNWIPTIKRSTNADSVTFELVADGIKATVKWNFKGAVGEYTRLFSNPELLGRPMAPRTGNWIGGRRACAYARQVIAGVLSQRGV